MVSYKSATIPVPKEIFSLFVPTAQQQDTSFPFSGRGAYAISQNSNNKNSKMTKNFGFKQQPLKTPNIQKYCSHCQKQFHTKEECFALHPELLETFRAKRARKTADHHQNQKSSNDRKQTRSYNRYVSNWNNR